MFSDLIITVVLTITMSTFAVGLSALTFGWIVSLFRDKPCEPEDTDEPWGDIVIVPKEYRK